MYITMSIELTTPQEMCQKIAVKAKEKRLSFNLSQRTLSDKSGVSYGVLKKFERTGQISLESLLKIALTLESMDRFHALFTPDHSDTALSLDDLIKSDQRKRGRK